MEYQLRHTTQYRYAHPVGTSYQLLHLSPRPFDRQQVLTHSVTIAPTPVIQQQRTDYFGNTITDMVIRDQHSVLIIEARAHVIVHTDQSILLELSPPWEQVSQRARYPQDDSSFEAAKYCFPSTQITLSEARRYAAPLFTPGKPLLRLAMELTAQIYQEFEYQGGVTDIYTPVPAILNARTGVCQDFAHVAIACMRAFGIPARYVSGYLLNQPSEGASRLVGADASHAWFSVWCPEFGWVDFDPTNNVRTHNEHITLAWGRDYSDVSPTRGFIHGGGEQTLEVAVEVTPITENSALRGSTI
jgi:transglutaminase-like putative cysteine protease